jgi:phosphoribosylformylglycinamidine cyclo-ligase
MPMSHKHPEGVVQGPAASTDDMYGLMQRTFGERVISNPERLGPLFSLDYDETLFRHNYAHPILVSVGAGLGAKLRIAFATGSHEAAGMDLVAVCANAVLVRGAEPLFFQPYMGMGQVEPEVAGLIMQGMSTVCKEAGCALLGREKAEVPGLYRKGEYDIAGFVVGVVSKHKLITGRKVRPGDLVVGLPSSGLHTNSPAVDAMVQGLFFDQAGMQCGDSLSRFGIPHSLGEELLAPTRMYVRAVRAVLRRYRVKQVVAGIVNVAGGGLQASIGRALPDGCAVELDSSKWRRPAIFDAIQQLGSIPVEEMYGTFNMGIGMALLVAPYYVESVVRRLRRGGEAATVIGRVVEGAREVRVSSLPAA